MKPKKLIVFVEGHRTGTLFEDINGNHAFIYEEDLANVPLLSLSLPKQLMTWTGPAVEAFIDGVLPDDRIMRQRIARRYGVSANNPFSLLTVIGLDCAGGAQFVLPEDVDSLNDKNTLRPISEREIKQRLLSISDERQTTWQSTGEHWSLNGAQDKIALRFQDGQWYEALGAAATTHIIKPGILKLHEQAFNEYLCLKTIEALDVPVSVSEFRQFDGLPAIVSKRWDRREVTHNGRTDVVRIHQEDLCQATGHPTEQKYQSQGGPGVTEIISAMSRSGLDTSSIARFLEALVLNFLMAGTDAHAKNYAIFEPVGERPRLAPLYDVASMFAYDTLRKQRKLAMSIGGEYNWERIELRHWLKLAQTTRESYFDIMVQLLRNHASALPDAMADAGAAALELSADVLEADDETQAVRRALVERIKDGTADQCARVLAWFA